MKNPEIKELNIQELKERIKIEKEMLQKLVFANTVAPLESPTKIRAGRRFIAQLNTEMRQKEYTSIREKCKEMLLSSSTITSKIFSETLIQVEKENGIKASKKFTAQLAEEMNVVVLR
jgi:large subunit ribosomal protein L29